MMFGGQTALAVAADIVASAREQCINFIDTAHIYHRGQSEKDIGHLLAGQRDYHDENLDETVRTLGDLITAGKIRSFGLSNFRGWRIAEVMRLCENAGAPQAIVCQLYYNLLNHEPEVEILPACAHYGLGVVPYSPLARGVLTSKYLPGQPSSADSRGGCAIMREGRGVQPHAHYQQTHRRSFGVGSCIY